MNRHCQLCVRVVENLTHSRAKVSENNIRGWFNEIDNYLTLNNIKDLAPTRIFNADETALLLNPKNNTAIVKKGSKVVYNRVNNNEKESITTLITGNAAGQIAPPLMLFEYQRIPGYITRKLPEGWGIGISNNGWMTGQNFFEYIANIFYPWLIQMNIELPIILYIDGHASHLTQPLTMFCMAHKIILIALYPNCTHILQPLDVSVFKPLKSEYVKVAEKDRSENNQLSVQKEDIANLLYKTLNNLNVKDILKNGFRRCGLYPFNANAVDYTKVITLKRSHVETIEQYSEQYKNALECIEKNMSKDTLDSFKKQKSKNWTGNIEDKNLFELWSKLSKTNCDETEIDNIVQEVEFKNMSVNEEEIPILKETDADMNMEEGDPLDYPLILCDEDSHVPNEDCNRSVIITLPSTSHLEVDLNCVDEATTSGTVCVALEETDAVTNMEGGDPLGYPLILYDEDSHVPNENCNRSAINTLPATSHLAVDLNCVDEATTSDTVCVATTTSPMQDISNLPQNSSENDNIQSRVPSPFKQYLYWPAESTSKKKIGKNKENLPSILTTKLWVKYQNDEDEKKRKLEEEKEERKKK